MTDPADRQAELKARNAAMQEQVTSLLGGLQRQTEQLREAQTEAMSATGRATSPDGLVTAHVNAAGIATDVEVSPSAFKTSTPDKLGRAFLQAPRPLRRTHAAGRTRRWPRCSRTYQTCRTCSAMPRR